MMIGKLGDTPLAAVGMAGKWTWFLTIVFFGFSSGASVFISQFYGAGDDAGMRRTYGLMTVGTQAAALLFMLAALLFPDGIVRLFSSDEQAIALGASYLRIIALSYPFLALTRGGGTLLQSTGDVMIPFVGSLISVAVNITLNALLIFGLCGFPALGVQGAAIGFADLLHRRCAGDLTAQASQKRRCFAQGQAVLPALRAVLSAALRRSAWPAMLNESMVGAGQPAVQLYLRPHRHGRVCVDHRRQIHRGTDERCGDGALLILRGDDRQRHRARRRSPVQALCPASHAADSRPFRAHRREHAGASSTAAFALRRFAGRA